MLTFAAALIAWTGVMGPTSTTTLKDWQTLIAAFVALGGGTMAYFAAMAKVYADRDRDFRELNRKKLGLCLRLRPALEKIQTQANDVQNVLTGYRTAPRKFPPSVIRIDPQEEELQEAWKNLELLPIDVSFELDTIRAELANAKRLLDTFPADTPIELKGYIGVSYGDSLYPYVNSSRRIGEAATNALRILDSEVDRIKAAL